MNPTAILALLSDLYGQVAAVAEENARLREEIKAQREQAAGDAPGGRRTPPT